MKARLGTIVVVCVLMGGFARDFGSGAGPTRLSAVTLCPVVQVCEDYASGCKTSHQGCSLSDTGLQECQNAPGQIFSCSGSRTIHIKTCPCTGTCGGQSMGTELVCS